MGSGCLKVTKYFLFLFNLLFLILGAVILGFGIWILADKTSFISVLQTSSPSVRTGAYILVGVGSLTMLMGFLGCLGAVNEIRCLLGLYFTCLMVILITQVAAGLVIYFQQEEVSVSYCLCLFSLSLSWGNRRHLEVLFNLYIQLASTTEFSFLPHQHCSCCTACFSCICQAWLPYFLKD
uniref:CD82 antigen n=1 Tax=Chrysolophus pictus TaxID=9089 RepID=A0A8C3L4H6_CHRPC